MQQHHATLLERPAAEARSVHDLVRAAVNGDVRTPPFQRGFRWGGEGCSGSVRLDLARLSHRIAAPVAACRAGGHGSLRLSGCPCASERECPLGRRWTASADCSRRDAGGAPTYGACLRAVLRPRRGSVRPSRLTEIDPSALAPTLSDPRHKPPSGPTR